MSAPKPTPRVRMPATAKAGEVIEVKTLISHEMESGQRKDAAGNAIPRKIIKSFVATFNGREVLRADWHLRFRPIPTSRSSSGFRKREPSSSSGRTMMALPTKPSRKSRSAKISVDQDWPTPIALRC